MRFPSVRKQGLEIGDGLVLRASEQPGGGWAAWIEQDGRPLEVATDQPRLFEGASRYQAQCEAMRWIRQDAGCQELRTRIREYDMRRRSRSIARTGVSG